jgi:hypothetical protein
VVKLLSDKGEYINSHKTTYQEIDQSFTFTRTENGCMFMLPKENNEIALNTPCKNKHYDFQTCYSNDADIAIIRYMSNVYRGTVYGGSKIKSKRCYHVHKGHRFILHTGKNGGQYIIKKGGGRVYVSKGGNDTETYKEVSFENTLQFISENVLAPMKELRPNLEDATVIYDERATLGSNEYVTIIYDFVDFERRIFYIPIKDLIVSTYTEQNIQVATQEEKDIMAALKQNLQSWVFTAI